MLKTTHATIAVVLSVMLTACATHQTGMEEAPASIAPAGSAPLANGYSGMAQLDSQKYVVVHDTKSYKDGARLGIVRLDNGVPRYEELSVDDWKDEDGRSSDLESICALPGRPGEFLAAESGYWEGKNGRIFHLTVQDGQARVQSALPLPLLADNSEDQEGDNFEGIACAPHPGGGILVVLGERGGSERYPAGVLRWGRFDPATAAITWTDAGKAGQRIAAPGAWVDPEAKRDISDLHLDPQGAIWAVATEDAGDAGPFRSVIYKVATLDGDPDRPFGIVKDGHIGWVVDGLKVEALSGPPGTSEHSFLSYGTEDEDLGGIWRPLYPAVKGTP